MTCVDIIAQRNGQMDNPTQHEIDAMLDAAQSGGEYLDGIGKATCALEDLEGDTYMQFVDAIVTGYTDSIRRRTGLSIRSEDQVPF
jgi:hypothetical protein